MTALRRLARRPYAISALVVVLAGLALSLVFAPVLSTAHAAAALPASTSGASPSSATSSSAMTKSKHVSRAYLDNGVQKTVDSRTVKVSVSATTDLRSLQQVKVAWSGAHVTDGTDLDENSDLAQNEEYSFDLFECRGTDSTSVPLKDRVSPETCWTQFADERFQAQGTEPAWQTDLYATPAEREAVVGAPAVADQTAECVSDEQHMPTQRWVPFVNPEGKTYYGGPTGCDGLPPEASPQNFSTSSLPSNETFGVTAPDGRGSANFDVFTGEDHASLGCSTKVPCSLVAIPIEGISCDPEGANLPFSEQPTQEQAALATTNCETNGSFTPGETLNGVEASGNPAVDGTLWWSPSNWKNRISFPLTFAQADNICSVVNTKTPVSIYGTELMTQAVTQWSPHFCLDPKLFNLNLVQTPEPESRRLLASGEAAGQLANAGTVDAAVSSYGSDPTYSTPTVNAPVAVSGFGIAFAIDNAHNRPVARLNLNARLLAKLLTESYPAETFVKDEYPETNGVATLGNNPLSLADDPEFQALNPGISERTADAASTLLTVNVQSDVMTALTTYINDDPAARAWLNGKPDPWGMRVNPNYKAIKLPVSLWPLLDSFEPLGEYKVGLNDCLAVDPVPYLPLVADPQASLYQIALDADFAIAQPQTTCVLPSPIPNDTAGAKLVANGRQPVGNRFMLSVVSLADAARFSIPLASLESTSTVSPSTKLTSSAGQTFVPPTQASMRAAASTAVPDKTSGTWPLDYEALRKKSNSDAYPGTMIMYASVPTKGLTATLATDYADFLRFAAGPGQVAGTAPGDLATGYLPMTKANGLGNLASYTMRAADAVQHGKGATPALIYKAPPKATPTPTPTPTPTFIATTPSDTTPTSPADDGGATPSITPTSPPSSPSLGSPSPGASPVVATPDATPAALGTTDLVGAGWTKWLLPAMLIVLVVSGGAAAAIRIRVGRGR